MRKDRGAIMSVDVRGAIGVHADERAGETSRATCRGNIDVTKEFEALTEALNGVEEMENLQQEMDGLYTDYDFVDDI